MYFHLVPQVMLPSMSASQAPTPVTIPAFPTCLALLAAAACSGIETASAACRSCRTGANAGFSTILFKLLWPEATVVMLEPDPSNFAILTRNTAT